MLPEATEMDKTRAYQATIKFPILHENKGAEGRVLSGGTVTFKASEMLNLPLTQVDIGEEVVAGRVELSPVKPYSLQMRRSHCRQCKDYVPDVDYSKPQSIYNIIVMSPSPRCITMTAFRAHFVCCLRLHLRLLWLPVVEQKVGTLGRRIWPPRFRPHQSLGIARSGCRVHLLEDGPYHLQGGHQEAVK